MGQRSSNAGAVLAFLDEVTMRFGPSRFLSVEIAWDAAWMVCMMPNPRHEAVAEAALADVWTELDRLPDSRAPSRAGTSAVLESPSLGIWPNSLEMIWLCR